MHWNRLYFVLCFYKSQQFHMLRNVQLNLIHREHVRLGRIVRTILPGLNKKFWFSFTNLNPFFKEIITISYKKKSQITKTVRTNKFKVSYEV